MARKKIQSQTNNDLGKFLTDGGKVEVRPRGKSKVKSEVKSREKGEVISEVEFTKQTLIELGFELEVLPSGQKTNLYHKQPYIINGFRPSFFRGHYTHTIHHAPDKIYPSIKKIEFL